MPDQPCKHGAAMSNGSGILRITHDIKDVQTGGDLSIAVAYKDSDMRRVRALIQGPPDTPYEFGFFEFDVKFGTDYPTKAPSVHCLTTNRGSTRFNPNIYADGKVCLSILGTWRGEPGEQWSSAQGLGSILWSIQSLMSSNPYENEPGFESNNPKDREKPERIEYRTKAASEQIHHETLRISVVRRLEGYLGIVGPEEPVQKNRLVFGVTEDDDDDLPELWEPFIDFCKRRFLWYYDSYKNSIAEARLLGNLVKDGRRFPIAQFEGGSNCMHGMYDYTALEKRLDKIQGALEAEVASWERVGREVVARENPVALGWSNTFKNLRLKFQSSDLPVELQLEDNLNPFVWKLILFGAPMTNLEGAILNIKLVFHNDFPNVWPRVLCQTPLFHHLISHRGSICYVPKQGDDIESHILAIVNVLQDESPRHDPRMRANPEAARLLWGTAENRKVYNRRLRRTAQESLENC